MANGILLDFSPFCLPEEGCIWKGMEEAVTHSLLRQMESRGQRMQRCLTEEAQHSCNPSQQTMSDYQGWGNFWMQGLFFRVISFTWASLITQLVKNPPAMQETPV